MPTIKWENASDDNTTELTTLLHHVDSFYIMETINHTYFDLKKKTCGISYL